MTAFDDAAIEKIPRLRRYARVLTHDRDFADLLVAKALKQVFDGRTRFQNKSEMYLRMFAATHAVLAKHALRAKLCKPRYPSVDGAPAVVVLATAPYSAEPTVLDQSFSSLPFALRSTLLLTSLEPFSYEQIAQITGVPYSVVRSRMAEARSCLHRAVSQYDTSPKIETPTAESHY